MLDHCDWLDLDHVPVSGARGWSLTPPEPGGPECGRTAFLGRESERR